MNLADGQPRSGASRLVLPQEGITRRRALQLGAFSTVAAAALTTVNAFRPTSSAQAATIFRDDFTGSWGSRPNGRWKPHLGPVYASGQPVNNEKQYYTAERDNLMVNGRGNLVLRGQNQERSGFPFTSARIDTSSSFSFTHGWVEARMILPRSWGSWPAFWLMPVNGGTWPNGGEIDIMERRGWEPDTISGALHGPGWSGAQCRWASHSLSGGRSFSDDWHTFALRKEPGKITWYCDGQEYFSVSRNQVPNWPFEDHEYYIILNQAIGGDLGGDAEWVKGAQWPQETLIDYVLVNDR